MDYKTTLMVVITLAIPAFIFVMIKLISMAHQERLVQSGLEADEYVLDREGGTVGFGDGESGKRPATSGAGHRSTYEHGAGEVKQTDEPIEFVDVEALRPAGDTSDNSAESRKLKTEVETESS